MNSLLFEQVYIKTGVIRIQNPDDFWKSMMDTIELVINRFVRYMSKLGLGEWQLRIVFLIFIILLIMIAIRKWKTRARLIRTIRGRNDQGIIGKRLYNSGANHTLIKDTKDNHQVSVTVKPIKEEKPDYKQSTSEWEKAQEQISQLQHEVIKHKQTEENLRQIIDELKKSNPDTLNETTKSENIEHYIRPDSLMLKNVDLQVPEVSQSEQAGKGTNESGQLHTDNQDRADTAEDKKIKGNSQQQGSPLDVNELKTIAELARRLGRNNNCQQ